VSWELSGGRKKKKKRNGIQVWKKKNGERAVADRVGGKYAGIEVRRGDLFSLEGGNWGV